MSCGAGCQVGIGSDALSVATGCTGCAPQDASFVAPPTIATAGYGVRALGRGPHGAADCKSEGGACTLFDVTGAVRSLPDGTAFEVGQIATFAGRTFAFVRTAAGAPPASGWIDTAELASQDPAAATGAIRRLGRPRAIAEREQVKDAIRAGTPRGEVERIYGRYVGAAGRAGAQPDTLEAIYYEVPVATPPSSAPAPASAPAAEGSWPRSLTCAGGCVFYQPDNLANTWPISAGVTVTAWPTDPQGRWSAPGMLFVQLPNGDIGWMNPGHLEGGAGTGATWQDARRGVINDLSSQVGWARLRNAPIEDIRQAQQVAIEFIGSGAARAGTLPQWWNYVYQLQALDAARGAEMQVAGGVSLPNRREIVQRLLDSALMYDRLSTVASALLRETAAKIEAATPYIGRRLGRSPAAAAAAAAAASAATGFLPGLGAFPAARPARPGCRACQPRTWQRYGRPLTSFATRGWI